MSSQAEARLKEQNVELPQPAAPAATYVPYRIHNNVVYISGQLPMWNGTLQCAGKVGKDVDLQKAKVAARICGLNILSQLREACEGDLDRVESCLRLGGFVNCTDDFIDQPKVINGASELMIQVFGENGMHARAAVGVNTLPMGATVEVDAMFALKK